MKTLLAILLTVNLGFQGYAQSGVSIAVGIDTRDENIEDSWGEPRIIDYEKKIELGYKYSILRSLTLGVNYTFSQGTIEPNIVSFVRTYNSKTYSSFGLDAQYNWKTYKKLTPFLSMRVLTAIDYPYILTTYEKEIITAFNYQIGGGLVYEVVQNVKIFGRWHFGQVIVSETKGGLVEEQNQIDFGLSYFFKERDKWGN